MQDKEILVKNIKKLNLFTSIKYLVDEDIDTNDEQLKTLETDLNLKLDKNDCIIVYEISGSKLKGKKYSGISITSSDQADVSVFDFVSGAYVFLQVNNDYDDVQYYFDVIQDYMKLKNINAENNLLIQRFLVEDNERICQFCLKIRA